MRVTTKHKNTIRFPLKGVLREKGRVRARTPFTPRTPFKGNRVTPKVIIVLTLFGDLLFKNLNSEGSEFCERNMPQQARRLKTNFLGETCCPFWHQVVRRIPLSPWEMASQKPLNAGTNIFILYILNIWEGSNFKTMRQDSFASWSWMPVWNIHGYLTQIFQVGWSPKKILTSRKNLS